MLLLKIKPEYNLVCDYVSRTNYSDDAGLDLFVQAETFCQPRQITYINHGISCEMVERTEKYEESYEDDIPLLHVSEKNVPYLLVPRSSISKTPLIMANSIGIIDAGYRGNIIAAVYNTSSEQYPYIIKAGTRLFQIVSPALKPFDVKIVRSLSETLRGSGGFGSTGA